MTTGIVQRSRCNPGGLLVRPSRPSLCECEHLWSFSGCEGLSQGQDWEFLGLEPTWCPSWMELEKARHVQELVGQQVGHSAKHHHPTDLPSGCLLVVPGLGCHWQHLCVPNWFILVVATLSHCHVKPQNPHPPAPCPLCCFLSGSVSWHRCR